MFGDVETDIAVKRLCLLTSCLCTLVPFLNLGVSGLNMSGSSMQCKGPDAAERWFQHIIQCDPRSGILVAEVVDNIKEGDNSLPPGSFSCKAQWRSRSDRPKEPMVILTAHGRPPLSAMFLSAHTSRMGRMSWP